MPRPKKKIKMTWAELRQQRDALARFELYLPTLQLKQQQLQAALLDIRREKRDVKKDADAIEEKIGAYEGVFNDTAGVNVRALSEPEDVRTRTENIAGVRVPVFESAAFPEALYSLFGTPPWVDQALSDQKELQMALVRLEIIEQKMALIEAELKKVVQRVNLFEKVVIPEAQDNIRRIRIGLGDRMTAAVARAKIAKEKLQERERGNRQEAMPV